MVLFGSHCAEPSEHSSMSTKHNIDSDLCALIDMIKMIPSLEKVQTLDYKFSAKSQFRPDLCQFALEIV